MIFKVGSKKRKISLIGSLILLITISIAFNNNNSIANQKDFIIGNEKNSILRTSDSNVNGKPLLIHQYSTITSTFLPLSLPKNVSFTLTENWISKNVTIYYDGVSHKKDWVVNGTFDTGVAPWQFFSSDLTTIYSKPWQPEYVEIEIQKNRAVSKGDYGYYEENFTIPEQLASNTIVTLSMNYKHTLEAGGTISNENLSAFISLEAGGIQKNVSVPLTDLIKNYWTEMSVTYDISDLGQQLPNNITIRAGVYVDNDTITSSKKNFLFLDNVQFQVWTEPNLRNLLVAKDVDFNSEYTYQNITFGKGKTFIDKERNATTTRDIKFIISKNSTIMDEFFVYNITIISEAVKIFNSTINDEAGSLYLTQAGINWKTEISISIPYGYYNNWAEIKKPNDWSVTSVLNGYGVEKKLSCFGIEYGSNSLIIPDGQLSSGLWTIQASGQNYITKGSMSVWNGTIFIEKFNVTYGDIFRIKATLNDTISLTNTQINCTIEYPNGTIFTEVQKEPLSYNVDFGEFTVGNNMSIGTYQISIIWTNNQSSLSRDKVGFFQYAFRVWHRTNLTAVEPYIEKLVGDPLLIKVKFMDYDFNSIIEFAAVNYSSSFGQSGTMIYIGSGIYFAEIDTNPLELGDYYFSFSAKKSFYENQTSFNLIHLKIIPQPLALDLSKSVIETSANNIVSCRINVSGAITKTLLWPANISTDWFNPYNVTDHDNGTYTLDFSTVDIPTHGYLESFTIEIFANKTGYGNTNEFLTLLVHPIPAIAKVNSSLISVYQDEIIRIKANYTDYDSNELIAGAICNVSWQGSYFVNPISNEFEIALNTTGLAVDYYTALITFARAGYETAFKIVTVVINEREVNMSVVINSIAIDENFLIEGFFQQQINISTRVFTTIGGIYLSGGTITWISENYQKILTEGPSTYFNTSIILDGAYFKNGINTIFLRFQQTNYTTMIFAFQLYIRAQAIDLTIQIDYQDIMENTLFEFYYNQVFQLSCRAYAEIESLFLSGGTMTFVNNEKEILIPEVADFWFNSSIIITIDAFSLGLNNVYIRFEQSNYSTTIFTFQLYIKTQAIDLTVQINNQDIPENHLVEISFNQNFQLSCRAYAEIDAMFLSGGTITFVIKENEIAIPEGADFWFNSSILISSNIFSLGSNSVYLRFEQLNYTTTVFAFQILVKQIKINVKPINFNYTKEGIEGEYIKILLRLTEENSNNIISNATLSYRWKFGLGNFTYISNGTYELSALALPIGFSGTYDLKVIILMESSIYESKEYSIIITITPAETPNYLMWILIGSLAVAIGTLGMFSLRTYVLLPRKRKKEAELLDKIQVYKDVKNIQAFMLIQKNSGLPIYTQEIRIFESDDDSFLVSGFIQAITNFSEVLIQREFTKYKKLKTRNEYTRYTIELDFNIFQLLVCDYGNLRVLIFLREKSSERLKKQLYFLTLALNSQYSEEFAKFTGDISSIRSEIEYLINQFLFVHYIGTFIITEDKSYVEDILNSGELKKLEMRLFNVILSITKEKKEFNLQNPLELIQEKDEDAVLKALDTLINKKLIISTYSAGLKLKK